MGGCTATAGSASTGSASTGNSPAGSPSAGSTSTRAPAPTPAAGCARSTGISEGNQFTIVGEFTRHGVLTYNTGRTGGFDVKCKRLRCPISSGNDEIVLTADILPRFFLDIEFFALDPVLDNIGFLGKDGPGGYEEVGELPGFEAADL